MSLRGGGNCGTLRIPREDWGTLGKIREITTHLKNPIIYKDVSPSDLFCGAPKINIPEMVSLLD